MDKDLILFIFFTLFQLAAVFIPFFNKDKTLIRSKSEKRLDVAFVFVSIIAFGFSLWIYMTSQEKENQKEDLQKKFQTDLNVALATRDSIHRYDDSVQRIFYGNKVDSSYEKSINASNTALAKYNLILVDSLSKVANKIDSKGVSEPQVSIRARLTDQKHDAIYIIKAIEYDTLVVELETKNNTAYSFSQNVYLFSYEQKGMYIDKINFLEKNITSSTRDFLVAGQVVPFWYLIPSRSYAKIETGVILFSGQFYSDPELKKKREYIKGYYYNFSKNEIIGDLSIEEKNSFMKSIENKK